MRSGYVNEPGLGFPNARGDLPPHRSETCCHRSKGVPQRRRRVPIFKLAGSHACVNPATPRDEASYADALYADALDR